MKERKSTHLTRKNYYLTPAERLKIREYIRDNPLVAQHKIGDIFGVSRGTISNISREPRHKEYYEKKIFQLTNHNNIISANMAAMGRRIILLERKLKEYEHLSSARR